MKRIKQFLLLPLIILFYTSCSDDTEATSSTTTSAGETSSGAPASIQFEDSAIMASFITLGGQINQVDSLLLLIKSADSVMRDSLLNLLLGDTLIKGVGIIETGKKDTLISTTKKSKDSLKLVKQEVNKKEVADLLKPPCGQIKKYKYQQFGNAQPKSYGAQKSFPRHLRGTYYNTINRNATLIVAKHALLYGEKKLDTIFKITPEAQVKTDQSTLLLSYLQSGAKIPNPYWVTDQIRLHKDTLFFKTIPVGTLSEYPTKKQIREYLKGNNTPIVSSFFRLK